jgi:chemotaxis protein MotB
MSRRFHAVLCCAALGAILPSSGCAFVPKSRLDACHAYNCQLQRKNQEVCALCENLRLQNQELANKNLDLDDQVAAQERLLAGYEQRQGDWDREREEMYGKVAGLIDNRSPLPKNIRYKLEDFAQRYPEFVDVDPETGISKFKSDVLFDLGQAQLRPESERVLQDFAKIFQDPSGKALQIMVVGHTDTTQIKRPETRAKYETNWDLSTDRANSVVKFLERSGIEGSRMGAVGYGPYQPVVGGRTTDALAKNRRVEIFILAPDAAVVGRSGRGDSY